MSRARDLSRLSNPTNFTPVASSGRVGLGSTSPTAKLNVAGIVSATAFYGDGSNLEGVASAGLGTAINSDVAGLDVIYYTNEVLSIGATITVDVPNSAEVAYTQYAEIAVTGDADLIVADGDDLIPDILGIGSETQSPGLLAGGGGRIRADNIVNKAGNGAPTFNKGAIVTGVCTATSFSGTVASSNLSGALPALDGSALTNLNIPAGFNELDAALFN
tara:strand:+ start:377 stop:1030 length:654 start_codon:yes stop_codon:yes gene_type:complete